MTAIGSKIAWFFGRLRVRFVLYVAVLLVIFTGLVLAINWRSQEDIVLDRLNAHVDYVTELMAMLAGDRLANGDLDGLRQIVDEIVELEDAMAVAVVSVDGPRLAESRGDQTPDDLHVPLDRSSGVHGDHIDASADIVMGDMVVAWVHVSRALRAPGAAPGGSILGNAAFGGEVESFRATLQRNALIGLAMFLLAIPLAAFLIGRATKGISAVTAAANQAAAGNLDVTVPSQGSGEIAELQRSFRTMQAELRKNIHEIEELAYTDGVTGLVNRPLFKIVLDQALAVDTPGGGAVLMIDLDHFKGVNDSHGHQFGDTVLNAVGVRLASLIGAHGAENGIDDWTLARFGSDEFALLVRDSAGVGALESLCNAIVDGLEDPFHMSGMRINVGGSIGVAMFEPGVDGAQLIQRSDLAMYAAKRGGRRRARFYTDDIKAAAKRSASLESDLRDAVRSNALDVYYQPVIRCDTLAIVGAEALVRWCHPREGHIEPAEFIPIAEDSGLIVDIGKIVLERGVNDFQILADEGIVLSLAVNVAAAQLQRSDFVPIVMSALSRSGFPAERLELELTESTALLASEKPEELMHPLKRLGVRFAIDDFGTGHSSLGRLPSLPFDTLKIDRTFVADLANNGDDRTIVELVTSLAHRLGLKIVAEGLEREDDYLVLRDLGVQYAQGFLWSPPLPFVDFAELVRMMRPRSEFAEPLRQSA